MSNCNAFAGRWLSRLAAGLLALSVAACGGGGGSAGTPVLGPGSGASSPPTTQPAVADLVIVLNKPTMSNSGTDSITATVTSIDANRAAVGGVPVAFTVNANAVITPDGTSTSATTGELTAKVTQGSDSTARSVTITATSGSLSRTVTFNVVQNTVPTDPQAAALSLTLSAPNIDNSGGRTIVAIATAVDANRNALPGIPVQLSVSDPSAFVTVPSGNQTNANGQVTGSVNIGQDRTNRTIVVTATSGALSRTAAFDVTGTQFTQASAVPSVVNAGAAGTVQYTLADVNGNPLPGVPITVTGSNLTTQTGVTGQNGGYVFQYTAPNTPGAALSIQASAGGAQSTVNVTIPGGSTVVPASVAPVSKTLNLSANVVSVNTGNTTNQISASAIFRDGSNAPVRNVRVLFDVVGDNGTGRVGSGTNAVLSDTSGTASTTYQPGSVSSPTNGVTVRACWKTTDFLSTETVANCPVANLLTTTLTIVSNPVSISIGTDNTVSSGATGLTYIKRYVVLVVDSAGNPKSDVQITPSVDLGGYGKGEYFYFDAPTNSWLKTLRATCANEDLNRNGVIDTGEDVNINQQLDPRKSDVAITLLGSTKTDANGVAVLQLEYPKNIASWVKYKITVSAAGVLSPPAYYPLGIPVPLPSSLASDLSTYDWLPIDTTALTTKVPPPAFVVSPYGISSSCTNTN